MSNEFLNLSLREEIKRWLESEYPHYFDPLNPPNVHKVEKQLTDILIEIEEKLAIRISRLVDQVKSLEDTVKKETQRCEILQKEVQTIAEQTGKLLSSSLWTRLKFLFWK